MEVLWKVNGKLSEKNENGQLKFAMHLSRRPGHSGQALIAHVQKEHFSEMTIKPKPLHWEGRVDIIDYAAINSEEIYDAKKAEECGLSVSEGPMFDCGPVVHFLKDGCHVINYRLHIYDFVTGEMKRAIVPDQPDFLFVNSFLSRDDSFIFGFRMERPYLSDFQMTAKVNEKKKVIEDPPRNLQVSLNI